MAQPASLTEGGARAQEDFDLGRRRGFEAPKPAYPFSLGRGSGTGGRAFECGSVVRNPEASPSEGRPEWLKVCREGHKYVARGGMEAGVGAERGYLYWADCREADPAEAGRAAAPSQPLPEAGSSSSWR